MAEVKFCGMRRATDVAHAAALGASYVGVIFTESPRRVTPDEASRILAPLTGSTVRRVGIFAAEPLAHIDQAVREAGLDVVQLIGRDAGDHHRITESLGIETWSVVRIGATGIDQASIDAMRLGDAVVLDTLSPKALGGTGHAFDWDAVAPGLAAARSGRRIVLAGGLRPENVARAIDAIHPDVVDVSSGVESSPGVKDHDRMAQFMAAATAAHTNSE